jgi:RNA polymerase sigma-70 factor, ECF subfamily
LAIPQPDMATISRAQRGDERAFAEIVRAYEVPVFNYVLRMIGDRALAEDLTQDVFLRVFRGLRGYSCRARFTTWLFQVTKNRVVDELRAAERRPRSLLAIEDAPQLEAVDAPIERSEAISVLLHAVDRLSPDLKEALLLRDITGLSYNEIADTLEVTLATVKWRIFKAREEVQQALEEQGVELSTLGESASTGARSTE